ncbi:MAG: thioredoxin domain-containing protein [Alphaproteobacteria bacterium]|nr:thioredoxin domain-containing protein [Alphaproteobacteria bacterium]
MRLWGYARSIAGALAAVGLLAAWGLSGTARAAEDAPPLDRAAIEQIVREYLLAHPDILIDMTEALEAQENAKQSAAVRDVLTASRPEIEHDGYSHVAGNPNGDVTIVEFFDYNCGYCKHALDPLLSFVEADGNTRLVIKEFPILGPNSLVASKAAMAAQRQEGKYWDFHLAMMRHAGPVNETAVFAIAQDVGLDVEKLKTDMADPAIGEQITKNHTLAANLKVTGTPTFVIGDQVLAGAHEFDELKAFVAQARTSCATC